MSETADRTESVFAGAVELTTVEERAAYLDQACAGDAVLRQRIEGLLKAHDRAGHLLDRPGGADMNSAGPTESPPNSLEQTRSYTSSGDLVGAVIAGRYKLLEQIGEGGMGTVWLAEQTQPVRRKVAIKLIKAGMDSKSVLSRFEAERQALALMDHPNIAKVFDGGTTGSETGGGGAGRPFFAMEYVKGVPFTEFCDSARLSVAERLALFVPVCQAVQHAHQKGIIHRDLKPSNILVCLYDGHAVPKVIDFGLAKAMHQPLTENTLHTAHGLMMGTPLYMSPEQAEFNNLDVDTRTDIYALGVILYELLTGSTPLEKQRFKEAAWQEMLRLIKEEEPPRPSARLSALGRSGEPSRTGPARLAGPTSSLASVAAQRRLEPVKLTRLVRGELDWIVMKCLEKERTRRYETANGLARDIERHLHDEPVEACPPSAPYRLRKFARKHRAALAAAATIVLLLAAGVTVSTWQAIRAFHAEQMAMQQRDESEQARRQAIESEQKARAAAEAESQARDTEAAQRRQAEAERNRAVNAEAEAKQQAAIATAVNDFLKQDLLSQADSKAQADQGFAANPNLTVREALNRASAKIGDRFKEQPLVEAAIQQAIGTAYCEIGAARQGLPHLERGWELRLEKLGSEHADTLSSVHDLGMGYHDIGEFHKSLALLQKAVAQTQEKLGTENALTRSMMHALAAVYQAAGQADRAIPLWEQLLAKENPDDSRSLTTRNNLALAYLDSGQTDKGLLLLEQTLAGYQRKLGPDHPDTLNSMHNLGTAYGQAGRLDHAIPLLEQALEKRTETLGPNHPFTLRSMLNLGTAYRHAGQMEKVLPLYELALTKTRETQGSDHPDALSVMHNLAGAYEQAGQHERALSLYEQTLAKRQEKLGPDHPDTLASMNNVAATCWRLGKLDRSVPLFEETSARMKRKLGADHPQTLQSLMNLGVNYRDAGRLTDGIRCMEEVLATARRKGPLPANLAWVPPELATTQSMLGGSLLEQKKYAEAEPLLLAGYEGIKDLAAKTPVANTPGSALRVQLTEALQRLVRLYEATNKPEEVARWKTLLLESKSN